MDKNDWYPDLLKFLLSFEQQMPPEFGDLLFPQLTLPFTATEDILVLKPGEVARFAYWPIKGHVRTYEEYKPEADSELVKQKTVGISVPGKVSLQASSFMNQIPSNYFSEICKGSTVVGFHYDAFKLLGTLMPEIFVLAGQITTMQNEDRDLERKMRTMRKADAYAAFLVKFGLSVESFIYQKHIASFLDTTPETLSRIRKEGGYSDEHLRN